MLNESKSRMKTVRIFSTIVAALAICSCTVSQSTEQLVVGTYGSAIHILSYNPADGSLGPTGTIPAVNASYVALGGANSKGEQLLYAVSENGQDSGVYSFAFDGTQWQQTAFCNEVGADPCYIYPVEGTGLVLTADYSGGSLSVFSTEDGAITGRIQLMQFASNYGEESPRPQQRGSAHIHQVKEIPSAICANAGIEGRHLLVSDLGNDIIRVMKLDAGRLQQVDSVFCGEGAGPRHMEFDAAKSTLYCITELSDELIAWSIGSTDGKPAFTQIQKIEAYEYDGNGSADIHIHPNGRWLYTSHRLVGDGVSSFLINEDGTLTPTGYTITLSHPRNFKISNDGQKMLVASKDADCIQVFDIDQNTGALTGSPMDFSTGNDEPVCLQ